MSEPGTGEGIPPPMGPEAAGVHAAADYAEHAGEEAGPLTQEEMRKRILEDGAAMFRMMVPLSGEPEENKRQTEGMGATHLDILTKITEKAVPGSDEPITLGPDEAIDIASKLGSLGINRNQANVDQFLEATYPMLDGATREEIKDNLPDLVGEVGELSKVDETEEAYQARIRSETLVAADERLAEADGDLTDELNNLSTPPTEARKEEIIQHQKKINILKRRITGYFAEGEKGRKYARIGGKVIYFSLLSAFILVLLEMNMINKAAASTSRRR
jgi:hypothetical protein